MLIISFLFVVYQKLSSFIPLLSTKFGGYADGIFLAGCVYLIDQEVSVYCLRCLSTHVCGSIHNVFFNAIV